MKRLDSLIPLAAVGITALASANAHAQTPAPTAVPAPAAAPAPAPAAAPAPAPAAAPAPAPAAAPAPAPAAAPAPAPAAAPAPAPVVAPAPAPVAAEPAPVAPVAEGAVEPAPAEPMTEVPPVEPVSELPPEPEEEEASGFPSALKIGLGLRSGVNFIFNDPDVDGVGVALDDGLGNQFNARPLFSGQLTEKIGFTFNLETNQNSVDVLDAIIQMKFMDELQLWIGQHIPAMERNNFNGPFYNNGWNLPITVQTLPFDIAGRDRGLTFWGLVADGIFKYHVSMVDLAPPSQFTIEGDPDDATDDVVKEAAGLGNARFAARATINLLDPENYYYTSGTYYGSQDTLALGAVYQYQKGVDSAQGDDLDNDLKAFTADLLFEKVLGESGTFTLNGAYWDFSETGVGYVANQGTSNAPGVFSGGDRSYLVGVSYLTPNKIGTGKLQPNVTLQIADSDETTTVVDAGVGYIVDGFNHRWYLNFRHADPGEGDAVDSFQIGAQVQL